MVWNMPQNCSETPSTTAAKKMLPFFKHQLRDLAVEDENIPSMLPDRNNHRRIVETALDGPSLNICQQENTFNDQHK